MSKITKVMSIAALAVVVAGLALAVSAEPAAAYGGEGWLSDYEEEMQAALAEALGMSVAELDAALAAGQTMPQIIEAQGVDPETLHTAMQAALAEVVAQAVNDGVLTQEQADLILAHADRPGPGAFGGGQTFGGGNFFRPGGNRRPGGGR